MGIDASKRNDDQVLLSRSNCLIEQTGHIDIKISICQSVRVSECQSVRVIDTKRSRTKGIRSSVFSQGVASSTLLNRHHHTFLFKRGGDGQAVARAAPCPALVGVFSPAPPVPTWRKGWAVERLCV